MALKQMPPRLAMVAPKIGFAPDAPASASRDRDVQFAYRAWYKTARWQKLRWLVLVRDLFTCKRCNRLEADTSKLVADHKIAHRGNAALFWDMENLQCLCAHCHDTTKRAEERARGGWAKVPTPPHP
jgi:5-methylcytosine-specific restriction protein A